MNWAGEADVTPNVPFNRASCKVENNPTPSGIANTILRHSSPSADLGDGTLLSMEAPSTAAHDKPCLSSPHVGMLCIQ
eukprot:scaffold58349_cov75-Attheya_sp.AAC.2